MKNSENSTPQILELEGDFNTELGGVIPDCKIRYQTWGELNAQKSNVVWVCHALTGNTDIVDWWGGLFGQDQCFSPDRYFIVCANVLGSCYGSTGPVDCTQAIKFHEFPEVTIRDMVKAHIQLRKHLGIAEIQTLIGGSLGGQQALEWAIQEPQRVKNLIAISTNAAHSPWGIAFNESQRMAIRNDPTWEENTINAGINGLKVARSIALLSYRSYDKYGLSQFENDHNKTTDFRSSSYQVYQGEKLAGRFNAFSYYRLSQAMDSHNVSRGRGDMTKVLSTIKARTLVIGISSDLLFPPAEQIFLASNIPNAMYEEVESDFGHDGFLTESDKLDKIIRSFLADQYHISLSSAS
ncbi:MAG: homoserine O-acetyltransferase [Bacteroidota bacterium]